MTLAFWLNAPVSSFTIDGDTVRHGTGFSRLRLKFHETPYGVYKLRIVPTYFWVIPFGVTFCEISRPHKAALFEAIETGGRSPA